MKIRISACLYFLAFVALAPVLHAQPATDLRANQGLSLSTLPVRNLLIEVRQISADDISDPPARLRGEVTLESGTAKARVETQSSTGQRTAVVSSQQQVLVLNGRTASIELRNSVPFRLVQTVFHNGTMVVTSSEVVLEAGTGFNALARWDGNDAVELTVSAAQSQGRYATQGASTATTLIANVGGWVTVAESDQQSMGQGTGEFGFNPSRQTRGTQVQVRVTVR